MELGKPYPHYCAVHNVYYGSPTDTIPANMCPLCGIKAELIAQPAPRTYEVARALSWCDAVENSVPAAPQGWQQGAAELIAEWRELSKPKGPVREENPISKGWRDASFAHADQLEAILKRHQEGNK